MSSINIIYENEILPIEDKINIGRDKENDIIINDDLISRNHCSIQKLGEFSLSITDNDSSNGTFVITNAGDIFEIINSFTFENLKTYNPIKLLIGNSYELEFYFPDFETKKSYEKLPPKSIGIIKNPGKLSIENIEIILNIYPNAAAVMIRRKLENLLFDKYYDLIRDKKMELSQMIQIVCKKYPTSSNLYKAMELIRISGNMGAHKEDVNKETVQICIKNYLEIENAIK